jgi:hypothetical protein
MSLMLLLSLIAALMAGGMIGFLGAALCCAARGNDDD